MKLIVQIPAFNEERTLPQTVADIPRCVEGIDVVEIMVLDDGSTDRTSEVAAELGVDHVLRNKKNLGLARTFRQGLDECLRRGADIIVNTDADNQYAGREIPRLVQPILDGRADIVVGDRQTQRIEHFSTSKKVLELLGSQVVRMLSGLRVPDAVSGFRAMSRDAAMRLNIISPFSYTIEMLIQAGKKHLSVVSVPVATNPKTRESRLYKSIPSFIGRSAVTMVRVYSMYQPLKVFFALGSILCLIGAFPIVRFLYLYVLGDSSGKIQSLVIGGVLLVMGSMTLIAGLVADLIASNRQLIEMTLEKVRTLELSRSAMDEQPPRDPDRTKSKDQ